MVRPLALASVLAGGSPAVWIVMGGVILVVIVFVAVRRLHPAGPVKRRQRHADGQRALAETVAHDGDRAPATADDKAVRRRLRHLERSLGPGLSDAQRHWFDSHLEGRRYRQAVESLAHWAVTSPRPVPPEARDELLAVAASLGDRGTVLGILHSRDHRGPHHRLHAGEDGRPGLDVPLAEFEELVGEALDSLPDEFLRAMTNVLITVEEEAEGRDLYGLYQGVPLTKRYYGTWYANPDRIFIYRRTICERCRTREEVRNQVRKTVVHEIAHHFGISDPRLQELGWA
jgi:predicted Zn-dependent protease with MMP-like domain